jgi:hypothetical protein
MMEGIRSVQGGDGEVKIVIDNFDIDMYCSVMLCTAIRRDVASKRI